MTCSRSVADLCYSTTLPLNLIELMALEKLPASLAMLLMAMMELVHLVLE